MTRIIAIDPGPTQTAYCVIKTDGETHTPECWSKIDNDSALLLLSREAYDIEHCVIEMVACYGMAVGAEVFETAVMIGRMMQVWKSAAEELPHRMVRNDVKMALCHATRGVNDGVIRQRIIDLYGGKEAAIGTKKSPGLFHGMKADCWQAFALGLAWIETHRAEFYETAAD